MNKRACWAGCVQKPVSLVPGQPSVTGRRRLWALHVRRCWYPPLLDGPCQRGPERAEFTDQCPVAELPGPMLGWSPASAFLPTLRHVLPHLLLCQQVHRQIRQVAAQDGAAISDGLAMHAGPAI